MAGKFNVFSTPSFDRELKKIFKKDKKIADILETVVEVLSIDSFNQSRAHDIKKLIDIKQGEGQWRIRSGNYRFRYDIIRSKVILHTVRNRSDAY